METAPVAQQYTFQGVDRPGPFLRVRTIGRFVLGLMFMGAGVLIPVRFVLAAMEDFDFAWNMPDNSMVPVVTPLLLLVALGFMGRLWRLGLLALPAICVLLAAALWLVEFHDHSAIRQKMFYSLIRATNELYIALGRAHAAGQSPPDVDALEAGGFLTSPHVLDTEYYKREAFAFTLKFDDAGGYDGVITIVGDPARNLPAWESVPLGPRKRSLTGGEIRPRLPVIHPLSAPARAKRPAAGAPAQGP